MDHLATISNAGDIMYTYIWDFLFFVRSWTGELHFMTDYIPTKKGFGISIAVLDEATIEGGDIGPRMCILEFLMYSHILGVPMFHPIPTSINRDDYEKILEYSFSLFGNRGIYASYFWE